LAEEWEGVCVCDIVGNNDNLMWECSKCGNCCRIILCKYLKDNLCTIYETRPEICRVKDYTKMKELNEACKKIKEMLNAKTLVS